MQTKGGTPRTCAGNKVNLIPYSDYSEERIRAIYGNSDFGYNPAFGGNRPIFTPDPREYYSTMRTAICDAEGDFEFNNIPDGKYFITSAIVWQVGENIFPQGGALMGAVEAYDGADIRVILSP